MKKEKKFPKNRNELPLRNGNNDPTTGMSWREWKQKRKEHKKREVDKNIKKQEKLIKMEKQQKASMLEGSQIKYTHTVSIAVPGAILDNAQSPVLKAYLAGQIARAASIFCVSEIIVYSECGLENLEDERLNLKKKQGCAQLNILLQYLELPQYLRKHILKNQYLKYAGLINPINLPHHLKIEDESEYREGIVWQKEGKGSFVYIGLKKYAVIDKVLEKGVRVTVKLNKEQPSKKRLIGQAVSPSMPYKKDGIYWGYNVRAAKGLNAVFSESPYKEGYDMILGTSDKGKDVDNFTLPKFQHLLIVFGGLKGIESALEGDESMKASEPRELFHHYLNTCPSQGCKTIRTEEALFITLSVLRPKIVQALAP